jgi:hypothetical protein
VAAQIRRAKSGGAEDRKQEPGVHSVFSFESGKTKGSKGNEKKQRRHVK